MLVAAIRSWHSLVDWLAEIHLPSQSDSSPKYLHFYSTFDPELTKLAPWCITTPPHSSSYSKKSLSIRPRTPPRISVTRIQVLSSTLDLGQVRLALSCFSAPPHFQSASKAPGSLTLMQPWSIHAQLTSVASALIPARSTTAGGRDIRAALNTQ